MITKRQNIEQRKRKYKNRVLTAILDYHKEHKSGKKRGNKKIVKYLNLTLVKIVVFGIIVCMRKINEIERRLKQALNDSDMSRAEIVRKSKMQLSEAQLSYFVNNKRSLTLSSASILAKTLGLELRPVEKGKKKKR